jgi:hypothetical protein
MPSVSTDMSAVMHGRTDKIAHNVRNITNEYGLLLQNGASGAILDSQFQTNPQAPALRVNPNTNLVFDVTIRFVLGLTLNAGACGFV